MSHLWLWAVWAALLVLLMVVSLRMDWLKVWWMDQLRRMPGDTAANDIDPGSPADDTASRPMPHHAPRPIGIPRPAVHDVHGHAAALTHHHRPAFHRTGRRHGT